MYLFFDDNKIIIIIIIIIIKVCYEIKRIKRIIDNREKKNQ